MDERGLPVHPEIVTYATQSAFFTAYDCLDIGKVKVEVATYERGQGQTGRAVAYLDVADLRLVIHAVMAEKHIRSELALQTPVIAHDHLI